MRPESASSCWMRPGENCSRGAPLPAGAPPGCPSTSMPRGSPLPRKLSPCSRGCNLQHLVDATQAPGVRRCGSHLGPASGSPRQHSAPARVHRPRPLPTPRACSCRFCSQASLKECPTCRHTKACSRSSWRRGRYIRHAAQSAAGGGGRAGEARPSERDGYGQVSRYGRHQLLWIQRRSSDSTAAQSARPHHAAGRARASARLNGAPWRSTAIPSPTGSLQAASSSCAAVSGTSGTARMAPAGT